MSSMNTFSSALFRAVVAAGAPVAIFWALDSRLNPEQGPESVSDSVEDVLRHVLPGRRRRAVREVLAEARADRLGSEVAEVVKAMRRR